MSIMWLTIILSVACVTATTSPGSCIYLSNVTTGNIYNNTCAMVVNYPFILPNGKTLSQLNTLAQARLNVDAFKFFPTTCQQSLVRYVCAQIYLECKPNITLTNPATYNFATYQTINVHYPIPNLVPCKSICDAVATQCVGLYTYLNGKVNCATHYDYSNKTVTTKPLQFDPTNNPSVCFSPLLPSISSSRESNMHAGEGFCGPVLQNVVFAPPGDRIKSWYATLQPPYAIQSLLYTTILNKTQNLPPFLSKECYIALRNYACFSAFQYPELVNVRNNLEAYGLNQSELAFIERNNPGILNTSFYLPAFPEKQICTNFETQCAVLLQKSTSVQQPNCSQIVLPAALPSASPKVIVNKVLYNYPYVNQTILSLKFVAFQKTYTIPFQSGAYVYSGSQSDSSTTYETKCPDGFVVPDNPNDDSILWVDGTGCALACLLPEWTTSEWQEFRRSTFIISLLGVILALALIISYISHFLKSRNSYLVLIYGALALIASATSLAVANKPSEEAFCHNNATPLTQKYGGLSHCVLQGAVLCYCILACCVTWVMESIDIFLKAHYHYDETKPSSVAIHLISILVLPIIPVVVAISYGYFGFMRSQPFCFIMSNPFAPTNADIGIFYIPLSIVSSIGCIVNIITAVSVTVSTYSGKRQIRRQESKLNLSLKFVEIDQYVTTTFAFIFFMYVVWGTLLGSRANLQDKGGEYQDGVKDWVKCVFTNWDGSTSSSWSTPCGKHPLPRLDTPEVTWAYICFAGQMIVLSMIYVFSSIRQWLRTSIASKYYAKVVPFDTLTDCDYDEVDKPVMKKKSDVQNAEWLEKGGEDEHADDDNDDEDAVGSSAVVQPVNRYEMVSKEIHESS